jgi:methylenetetrahydrofolate dehydrogenase (NADP+)/methenyltetrahydrofolate cyclohydrolase
MLQHAYGVVPHLAVLLVGNNSASRIYVNNKIRAAGEAGISARLHEFDPSIDPQMLFDEIQRLNSDSGTHGILVQLPLPPKLDILDVLGAISPSKDVDGFHVSNMGGLAVGDPIFRPCTPLGIMKLLEHERIPVAGQNAVVVGASNIVGKPMALMVMRREATVSVCHARTRDLAEFTRLADILVVAAGVPNLIRSDMIKLGAVVVDVGINRLPDNRIVGDVDFEGVKAKASHITPVPGGVGPMTVSMLLANTVSAAERILGMSARPEDVDWVRESG